MFASFGRSWGKTLVTLGFPPGLALSWGSPREFRHAKYLEETCGQHKGSSKRPWDPCSILRGCYQLQLTCPSTHQSSMVFEGLIPSLISYYKHLAPITISMSKCQDHPRQGCYATSFLVFQRFKLCSKAFPVNTSQRILATRSSSLQGAWLPPGLCVTLWSGHCHWGLAQLKIRPVVGCSSTICF